MATGGIDVLGGEDQLPIKQPVHLEDAANLIASDQNIDIFECDKTGNVRQQWIRTGNGQLIPVRALDRAALFQN